ncbi:MAG: peptidoglycan editing factor PgeF [Tabrizicola sp.]|nr:peptidoglycan editing factor PgeF [Tabrizicola sp.]
MLEIITSPAIGPRHGFFTRKGGASSGVFEGLNCGTGSSDLTEIVAINRGRMAEAMGLTVAELVTVDQVHSATAISVSAPLAERPKADALVTATPGLLLGVLTADCQPVLFSDPKAAVIGAAHAGWRGALNGILEATVDAMEALGARRADISAVIGPTISQVAYEVGPELFETFVVEDRGYSRFFTQGKGDRLLFDLPAFGLHRLREAGVGAAEWTGHCTYLDARRFYSYRRTTHAGEADYGRLISAIRL